MKGSFLRQTLDGLNAVLAGGNLKLDTLTAARQEQRRLQAVVARQGFTRPVFAVPAAFESPAFHQLLAALPDHRARFDSFQRADQNEVGYEFANGYFSSPDTEVLYSLTRQHRPPRILEIGCGHSTKIIRQAIRDGGFACRHTCIDPFPRQDISRLADAVIRRPIEGMDATELAATLRAGDVLFIDTSHEVKPANDVAFIYGCLLPQIAPGVIIHIHDIFLPYDYPEDWVIRLGLVWGEQYIVQAMLTGGQTWESLWAGSHLQHTLPDFASHFPHLNGRRALSLWLRKS